MFLRATALIVAIFATSVSLAQITPARPNNNNRVVLTVTVKLADGRPVPVPAEVQVISSLGSALAESFTHDDGRVEFNDIPSGAYRLRVSGLGLMTVVGDAFDIGDNDRTHFESIIAKMKTENPGSKIAPVNSQDFTVPSKAREEMEKGMDAFARNDPKKAADHLRNAIRVFPRFALAHYNLGVVLGSQGDGKGAETEFNRSIDSDPHFVPGFIILARLKSGGRTEDAIALLEKALAIDPNNVEALALLARQQFDRGDFSAALTTVQKVHSLPHEHFADVHLISAEICQKENRNAEAIAESELYLKEFPNSPRAAQVRAAIGQIQVRK